MPPRFNAIPGECLFASRRSFLRDTKCYTIAHDRAEENINGRLTYPSIVLVINDLSRSTHTDTRDSCTNRQTKICYCTRAAGWIIALCRRSSIPGIEIFLACNIQNNPRGSARTIRFAAFVETLNGERCRSIAIVYSLQLECY